MVGGLVLDLWEIDRRMASLSEKITKSRKAVAQLRALGSDGSDQSALEAEVARLETMEDCAAIVERDAVLPGKVES